MLGDILRDIRGYACDLRLVPSDIDTCVQASEPSTKSEVLDPSTVANLLNLPRKTVLDLCRQGRLPATKIGWRWVFHREAFLDWLHQKSLQNLNQANAISIPVTKPRPSLKNEDHDWMKISRPEGSGATKNSLINSNSQDAGVAQKRRQKCRA